MDLEVRSVGVNHFELRHRGQGAALDLDDLQLLATLPLRRGNVVLRNP